MKDIALKIVSFMQHETVRRIVYIALALLGVILVYGMGKRIGEFIFYIRH